MAFQTSPPDPESALGVRTFREEVRRAQASLGSLAGVTGGFAILNQNDVREGLDRIVI